MFGIGVEKDPVKAAQWLEKAASENNGDAEYLIAIRYRDGDGVSKDPSKYLSWLKKAAEAGVIDAQYDLGMIYLDGKGIEADRKKGFEYLTSAYNAGSPKAAYILGLNALTGGSGKKDLERAVELLLEAAKAGIPDAQYRLATIYETEIKDQLINAYAWYYAVSRCNYGDSMEKKLEVQQKMGDSDRNIAQNLGEQYAVQHKCVMPQR